MPKEYDIETRIQAAIAWLITGDTETAGELCGITGRTIRYWQTQPWWEDVLKEAQGIKQKELDALWTGLIHKSAKELRDRLDNGDPTVVKGEIKRVPVKAKDLAFIAQTIADKRAILRGQATQRIEKVSIDQKLDKITDRLKEVTKSIEDDIKEISNFG